MRGVGGRGEDFAAVWALDFDLYDVAHARALEFQMRHVVPKLFEPIEFALVRVEDVQEHAAKIGHDPLAEGETVHAQRGDVEGLSHLLGGVARNGFELWLGGTGADDVKIGECGNAAQIEHDDVFGFLVRSNAGAKSGEFF